MCERVVDLPEQTTSTYSLVCEHFNKRDEGKGEILMSQQYQQKYTQFVLQDLASGSDTAETLYQELASREL
ncbi:MAG: hypothetical protein E6J34_14915 [Chloroflexi bacterium]|nr:MAG: hypothetical protein E6J34_14915 [Chloroflexota bacterium]